MNKLTRSLLEVHHLEDFSSQESFVHSLSPLLKLLLTFIHIIFVLTLSTLYQYIAVFLILLVYIRFSRIPVKEIFRRAVLGLPVSFFLGLSNLILVRTPIQFYSITLTVGLISMMSLMLKTFYSLSFVFLLASTTSFEDLSRSLVTLHVPYLLTQVILMTYRYIFLLVEEASNMSEAYLLRHPQKESIEMKHMGSFLGSLLIRSIKRAESIHNAMILRGYDPSIYYSKHVSMHMSDYFVLMIVIGMLIIIKVVI